MSRKTKGIYEIFNGFLRTWLTLGPFTWSKRYNISSSELSILRNSGHLFL